MAILQHEHPSPTSLTPKQVSDLHFLLNVTHVTLLGAMLWQVGDDWHMRPRTLPDTFFFLPLTGSMNGMANGVVRPVLPGQFMMVPEGMIHEGWLPPDEPSLEVIAIHCHLVDAYRRPVLPLFPRPFGEMDDAAGWRQRLELLVTLVNSSPVAGQAYGELLIRELLIAQVCHGVPLHQEAAAPDERIARALLTIRQHYGEPLTVEDLAREAKLSDVQFRKLFRRCTGESPKAYLAHYRLRQAAHLLKSTSDSVRQIAARTGYGSDHYFHLTFKKQYGCTASEYREHGPAL